jgi:hypothetical protein
VNQASVLRTCFVACIKYSLGVKKKRGKKVGINTIPTACTESSSNFIGPLCTISMLTSHYRMPKWLMEHAK